MADVDRTREHGVQGRTGHRAKIDRSADRYVVTMSSLGPLFGIAIGVRFDEVYAVVLGAVGGIPGTVVLFSILIGWWASRSGRQLGGSPRFAMGLVLLVSSLGIVFGAAYLFEAWVVAIFCTFVLVAEGYLGMQVVRWQLRGQGGE